MPLNSLNIKLMKNKNQIKNYKFLLITNIQIYFLKDYTKILRFQKILLPFLILYFFFCLFK
jgi:hypothetical protein